MRLVSSDLALSEVLALSAGAELTLSQLARAVDTTADGGRSTNRIDQSGFLPLIA